MVAPSIIRQDTHMRQAISPEERLSICLRYLATGDSFRSIAFAFRMGASTVAGIVHQVLQTSVKSIQVVVRVKKMKTSDIE
ncbi:unnamed protein product [Gadus morhua 'NCC']